MKNTPIERELIGICENAIVSMPSFISLNFIMTGYTAQLVSAGKQFLLSENATATQRALRIKFYQCVKNFQITGKKCRKIDWKTTNCSTGINHSRSQEYYWHDSQFLSKANVV